MSKAALNMAVMAAQPDYPRAQFVLLHPGWVHPSWELANMGAPRAPLTVQDSAAALRQTLATHKSAQTVHGGEDVPFLLWDGRALTGW